MAAAAESAEFDAEGHVGADYDGSAGADATYDDAESGIVDDMGDAGGMGAPRWAGAADDPLAAAGEADAHGGLSGAAAAAIEAALAGVDAEDDMDDMHHELPEFASKEAQQVMADIKAAEKLVERAEEAASGHRERIRVMEEHLKNVKQEVVHTEKVLESRRKELNSEDHLKQLAEREIGRIRQELKELETRGEDVADLIATSQADVHTTSARLETVRDSLQVSLEELTAWTEARRQKDEDGKALARYTKADSSKLKDLSLALGKLTKQVSDKKAELETAAVETSAKQIELDKAAEDFHTLHEERQRLVSQVEDTLATITRRDDEINEASLRAAQAAEDLEARKRAIREKAGLLQGMETDNDETERLNVELGRRVGATREHLRGAQDALRALEDEAELTKSETGKAASQLTRRRGEEESLRAQEEEAQQRLEAAVAKEKAIVKERGQARAEAGKLESAAERREKDLRAQEGRLVAAERDLEQVKGKLFKEAQKMADLKREEGLLLAQMTGAESAAKNLAAKMRQLDTDAARQAELLYAAEFQIQAMERKLARVKGEVSDEEKRRLEARIADLNLDLTRATETKAKLESQMKQLVEDARRASRRRDALAEELTALHGTLAELRLQTTAGETQMGAAVKQREEAQVAHDAVKLEVRRLRAALTDKTDEVFGLENRHEQLQLSIAERRKEIEVHTKLQRAMAKLAEEERHRVAMDLRARESRVAGLQRKYDALRARVRGSADGEGETKSQAYFVIKAAQQREELQREGDELNAAVLTAEREVRALNATLAQLRRRNTAYRESFQKADPRAKDTEAVASLETLAKDTTEGMYRRKRELQEAAVNVAEAEARRGDLLRRHAALQSQLDRLRGIAADLQRQRDEQAEAVEAGEEALQEAVHEVRSAAPPSTALPSAAGAGGEAEDEDDEDEDADRKDDSGAARGLGAGDGATAAELRVKASALQHSNSSVLFTLGQLAREFPQLSGPLRAALARRRLAVPAKAPRRTAAQQAGASASLAESSLASAQEAQAEAAGAAAAAARPVPVQTFDMHA
jgi:chromosome segregation ATPase